MKAISLQCALSALVFLGLAGAAHAATPYSTSNIYFDESGAVVGQNILLCSNLAYHAGNIHTAYSITQTIACTSYPNGAPITTPPPDVIVPGTQVTSYVLPSFLTITQGCAAAECVQAGSPELPRLVDKGWTWQTGLQ
ncbi:hypothetical protein FHW84_000665 [Dyella sp. SG562]|jgi:hypothetical protein|uniref:hypothetical protein n=1 Tax=Dyella TaxID=231454 RepID=UPI001421BA86|nr:hypothetical protein [Dyella sp. SG562]NII72109.1 hypothetical protein [Dyella sp. SG562]